MIEKQNVIKEIARIIKECGVIYVPCGLKDELRRAITRKIRALKGKTITSQQLKKIIADVKEDFVQKVWDSPDIYFHHVDAMDFLKEEDVDLKRSLQIAKERGYTIETIDSGTLADLLTKKEAEEELLEILEDIEKII